MKKKRLIAGWSHNLIFTTLIFSKMYQTKIFSLWMLHTTRPRSFTAWRTVLTSSWAYLAAMWSSERSPSLQRTLSLTPVFSTSHCTSRSRPYWSTNTNIYYHTIKTWDYTSSWFWWNDSLLPVIIIIERRKRLGWQERKERDMKGRERWVRDRTIEVGRV